MIVVEFDLYEQKWRVSWAEHDPDELFKTKDEALASVGSQQSQGQHVIVRDTRFARHPALKNLFISKDGAGTFYQMYRERGLHLDDNLGELSFEDWVEKILDTDFD